MGFRSSHSRALLTGPPSPGVCARRKCESSASTSFAVERFSLRQSKGLFSLFCSSVHFLPVLRRSLVKLLGWREFFNTELSRLRCRGSRGVSRRAAQRVVA